MGWTRMDGTRQEARLTEQQRRLVQANLWLVNLHLRRKVRRPGRPGSGRSREDLFQQAIMPAVPFEIVEASAVAAMAP